MTADLGYHLRELRADLGAALDALDRAAPNAASPPERRRAWVEVEALLEHDLDVHVAAAAALLGDEHRARRSARRAPAVRSPEALEATADEIRQNVQAAIGLLTAEPISPLALAAAATAIAKGQAAATAGRAFAARVAER